MAVSYNSKPIVTNGLIHCLDACVFSPLSTPNQTAWRDISASGNNGTIQNGATYDNSNNGRIVFDGSDDYVSFTSNPTLTNQVTVEVWTNLDAPVGVNGWIVGREGSYRLTYATGTFQWVCATSNNSWYSAGTYINANFQSTSIIRHVVATYDGSNNRIYLDGDLKITGSAISGNILTFSNLELIRSGAGNLSYGKGSIYCYRMYNRALTAAEVTQNFNALRGRYGI